MWMLENKKEYKQRSKRKKSSGILLTNERWIFLKPKKSQINKENINEL